MTRVDLKFVKHDDEERDEFELDERDVYSNAGMFRFNVLHWDDGSIHASVCVVENDEPCEPFFIEEFKNLSDAKERLNNVASRIVADLLNGGGE